MEQTREQSIAAIRELARVLEENPGAVLPHEIKTNSVLVFCHTPEEWHTTVRAFGEGTKDADNGCLIFRPKSIPFLQIRGFKAGVCEAVVVGNKFVPERIIPEVVYPAHHEEILEWKCRPFSEVPDAK